MTQTEVTAQKIKAFDLGREAAKRDRAIYGRPWLWDILRFFSDGTDFGRGYWFEITKQVTMTEKIED